MRTSISLRVPFLVVILLCTSCIGGHLPEFPDHEFPPAPRPLVLYILPPDEIHLHRRAGPTIPLDSVEVQIQRNLVDHPAGKYLFVNMFQGVNPAELTGIRAIACRAGVTYLYHHIDLPIDSTNEESWGAFTMEKLGSTCGTSRPPA